MKQAMKRAVISTLLRTPTTSLTTLVAGDLNSRFIVNMRTPEAIFNAA